MYKSKHIYYNNHSNSNIICYINQHIRGTQQNTSYQTLSATYNMFHDPITITENTTVNFDYNYNNQRSRVTYANSAKTKYYSEGMQVEVIKNNNDYKFITYIDGDPYSANIIYVKTQSSSGYYYLHRDNQGTILGISDSSGIMIEQRIFDPWGNLKQGSISFIERGYTGHEHFLEISLIHMNARLYDPVTKMFLTPDNVLQDPYNPQNYNKFGYCLNNPLKYTDPSGNVIPALLIVGVGVSAFISGLFYVAQNAYNQHGFDWGGLGLSILQGAVSGAAAYGIGSAFTTASVVAALGKTGTIFAQAAAHGLSQATISGIFRGDFSNFGSDFAAGAVSSLVGSGISKLQIDNPALRKLSMYVGGAISGGLAASVTGGDFLDGAATGLIVTALNHAGHEVGDQIVSEQQEKQFNKQIKDILKELNIDKLIEHFPGNETSEISPEKAYLGVGGDVADYYKDGILIGRIENACALRLSIAMNDAGYDIPEVDGTLKGANGKNYFLSSEKLANYISKNYNVTASFTYNSNLKNFIGNKGIYFMEPVSPAKFGAVGHITIWNKNTFLGGHGYNNTIHFYKATLYKPN